MKSWLKKWAKRLALVLLLSVPGYLFNNLVVAVVLVTLPVVGVVNIRATWIGDAAGILFNLPLLPRWISLMQRFGVIER